MDEGSKTQSYTLDELKALILNQLMIENGADNLYNAIVTDFINDLFKAVKGREGNTNERHV